MDLSQIAWSVLGFFAPAVGVAAITAAFAKLFWRHALTGVGWWRLAGVAAVGSGLVQVAGLVGFGHDGMIVTYASMVVVCGWLVWWLGFGPGS